MADLTLPLTCFCDEMLPLVKQLMPFRFSDDAALKRLLESAWTKLKDKNKRYYVKKAEERDDSGKTLSFEALTNTVEFSKDDVFEIYRTEMRLILLQDPGVVKDHFPEIQDVIQEGWNGLKDEQRLYLLQRAILAKEDSYTQSTTEYCSYYVQRKYFYHNDLLLTNEIDQAAFGKYAYRAHSEDPSLIADTLWTKWVTELTNEERESYYQRALQKHVLNDAKFAFEQEKRKEIENLPQYAKESGRLYLAWNDLSDLAQLPYITTSSEKVQKDDQDPELRFKPKHVWPLNREICSNTTFDDVTSRLEPIQPYTQFHNYIEPYTLVDKFALLVYIYEKRPDLLKQPGMVQKRYWEINLILKDQWQGMSMKAQKPYYDMVNRFLEIRTSLRDWKLEKWDVAGKDNYDYFRFFDAQTQEKHTQIALRNRKILMKKYPDLLEYFAWITHSRSETNTDVNVASESSTDTKNIDAGTQDVENVTEKSDGATLNEFYGVLLRDSADITAFHEYQNAVKTMTSTCMMPNVWWNQFVNLTDEERNVYYDAASEKKVLKKAQSLFAKDHCPVIQQSDNDDEYAKEMPRMREIWEGLSDPAKEYYTELAEQEVQKQENKIKEDGLFLREGEVRYDIDKKPSKLRGVLHFKRGYRTRSLPYNHACTIYLQKHHEQLWKEPEMADKRYFQVAMILEQRFKDFSDEERQPYFDIVNRVKEIEKHLRDSPHYWRSVYFNRNKSFKTDNVSNEEKSSCRKEAKQNIDTFLKTFSDLGEYCYWIVTHKNTKSATNEPEAINAAEEMAKKTESSATSEVVNDVTVVKEEKMKLPITLDWINSEVDDCKMKLATLQEELFDFAKLVNETLSKSTSVELQQEEQISEASATWKVVKDQQSTSEVSTSADTDAVKIAVPEKVNDVTSKLTSDNLLEPLFNVTSAEESGSGDSFEVLDNEKTTEEIVSSKSTEEPKSTVNSIPTKKTPTAFMFYKKAMRRLNDDQNFGKKDNESQRKALISDWKKLSDEEKAVYLKMENRARAEAKLLQLL